MPVPANDKLRVYSRYAAHCLELAPATNDEESRADLRERTKDGQFHFRKTGIYVFLISFA